MMTKIRATFLVGCIALTTTWTTAKSKVKTPAPVSFAISAAHSYDLTGPYRFETLFTDMAGFHYPDVQGSAPDGHFVFQPKGTGHPGGAIQITFRSINARFHFVCDGGNTAQIYELLISGYSPGGATRTTLQANSVGNFSFDTPVMQTRADLVVIITSATTTQPWSVDRCDVTPIA